MTLFTDVPKSTPHIQLPSFSTLCAGLSGCLVPARTKLCLKISTFKVYFMALENDPAHMTMFNTFAPDVLNSLQNKTWCTYTVHQLQIFISFNDC